ncbi:polysaccharide deacetylase family protein [Phytohabitans sp. ZYX-F-186]|uniref:Polysaccharide deacetylase family protein n=1 Tax=Phytohabitans maris TaxID=3071409 RepID=A0ABU0ZSY5_9ACTN|nr:polysaccharide deacetylase family protein [Phytohabitans sp. ZYX-F-186]MDQ7910129.1 polysaccharide deacetylase family protein [Phytohabitans sp. ZYX-F-186]
MNPPVRDFVGYGRRPPVVRWPGDARVAVSIVVNYEEGSERSFDRDGVNEGLGEVPRRVDAPYRDLATESVYEYGSRAGVHRLLRLFARYDVATTFFAAAEALERNPEVCAALRDSGHEVCAHGWRWTEEWTLDVDAQRAAIERAVRSIEATCGQRPVGWYSRWMPSVDTRRLLVEEGGFRYDSNAYNDDLPYFVQVGDAPFLVVPYSLTFNDSRHTYGQLTSASDFFDECRRGFDYLWEEGDHTPRMLSIGVHPRLIGQPSRTSALRDFIDHVLTKGGAWFARRRDIAETWWNQHPTLVRD